MTQEEDQAKRVSAAEKRFRDFILKPQEELLKRFEAVARSIEKSQGELRIHNELLERDIFPELQTLVDLLQTQNGVGDQLAKLNANLEKLNDTLKRAPGGSLIELLQGLGK